MFPGHLLLRMFFLGLVCESDAQSLSSPFSYTIYGQLCYIGLYIWIESVSYACLMHPTVTQIDVELRCIISSDLSLRKL
jgi:hypothetical protein